MLRVNSDAKKAIVVFRIEMSPIMLLYRRVQPDADTTHFVRRSFVHSCGLVATAEAKGNARRTAGVDSCQTCLDSRKS